MSGTPYNGLNANVAFPALINISSSTAANPTVIQTSSAHGLITGDYVDIYNHTVNYLANCVAKQATVIDSTHFSIPINTTTGSAGGATGVVAPLQFTGNVGLNPANGDALSAATWIPGMSCTQDRTSALLANTAGAYKLVNVFTAAKGTDRTFTSNWFSFNPSALPGYTPVLSGGSPVSITQIQNAWINDVVEVDLSFTLAASNGTGLGTVACGLYYATADTGLVPSVYVPVLGSEQAFQIPLVGGSTPTFLPMRLYGQIGPATSNQIVFTNGATVGPVGFQLWVYDFASGSLQLAGQGDYTLTIRQWRPTGVAL